MRSLLYHIAHGAVTPAHDGFGVQGLLPKQLKMLQVIQGKCGIYKEGSALQYTPQSWV